MDKSGVHDKVLVVMHKHTHVPIPRVPIVHTQGEIWGVSLDL